MFISVMMMLAGGWQVERSVDPITDATRTVASLSGSGGSIVFFCARGKNPEISFRSDTFLGGSTSRRELRDFTYRFDDERAVRNSWEYVRDSVYPIGNKNSAAFVTKMVTAKRLRVRALRYDNVYVDGDFDLTGAAPALNEAFTRCGIKPG